MQLEKFIENAQAFYAAKDQLASDLVKEGVPAMARLVQSLIDRGVTSDYNIVSVVCDISSERNGEDLHQILNDFIAAHPEIKLAGWEECFPGRWDWQPAIN